jgi:hypothetical protein
MFSIVGARGLAPDIGHAPRAPTTQGAQKIKQQLDFLRNKTLPSPLAGEGKGDEKKYPFQP